MSETYYTISNSGYFLGTVCLLNSLRLTGNRGTLVVLDRGLTPAQRSLLEPHARLVRFGDIENETTGSVFSEMTLKPYPHLLGASGSIVIIDSDMIVTSSLSEILVEAKAGSVCMFENPNPGRWFEEWEEEFMLGSPLRRDRYHNAGFVAFSTDAHPDLLERYWTLTQQLDVERLNAPGDVCRYGDQDVLNALLMSEIPAGALASRPADAAPMTKRLQATRIVDADDLSCELEGHSTMLLHQAGTKPWGRRTWMRVRANTYGRLMPRLLFGPNLTVRVPASEAPLWLRSGIGARACFEGMSLLGRGVGSLWQQSPGALRRRLRAAQVRVAPHR